MPLSCSPHICWAALRVGQPDALERTPAELANMAQTDIGVSLTLIASNAQVHGNRPSLTPANAAYDIRLFRAVWNKTSGPADAVTLMGDYRR